MAGLRTVRGPPSGRGQVWAEMAGCEGRGGFGKVWGPLGVGGSLLVFFFFFLRAQILDEFPLTLEVHGPGAQAVAGPASLRLGARLSPHL